MPTDVPKLVQASSIRSFESICYETLKVPGEKLLYTYIREYATGNTIGYDPIEVSIVVAKLQRRGLLVDYGTEMTSKVCRDYIIIKEVQPELKVEAKLQ